jgi:hypothetical protein
VLCLVASTTVHAQTADEVAKELANPNTSLATLTLKTQYRTFEGNLPNANDQTSKLLLFQPGLPFVLESGAKIIWRPAVSVLIDQPLFNSGTGSFEEDTGLGDIAFDLAYAPPPKDPSQILAFGMIMSLPTASDRLGTERYTLGPELLYGKISEKYVVGLFPNHQWDIGGSGDVDINLTTIQAFLSYLPGGGLTVGSGPIMTYDWNTKEWTVPIQLNIGKTITMGGRPWKLGAEINRYAEKPVSFGPEWMLSFSIAPLVENGLAGWFK